MGQINFLIKGLTFFEDFRLTVSLELLWHKEEKQLKQLVSQVFEELERPLLVFFGEIENSLEHKGENLAIKDLV